MSQMNALQLMPTILQHPKTLPPTTTWPPQSNNLPKVNNCPEQPRESSSAKGSSPWLRTLLATLGILQRIPILQGVLNRYRERQRKFAASKEAWMKGDRAQHIRKAFDEVFATYRNGPALLNILFGGNYPPPEVRGENDRTLAIMQLPQHEYARIDVGESRVLLRVVFAIVDLLKKVPILREKIANYKEDQRRVVEFRDKCIQKSLKEEILGALKSVERSVVDHLNYLSILRNYEDDEMTIEQKVLRAAWSYETSCEEIQTTRDMLISELKHSYKFYTKYITSEKGLRESLEELFEASVY